MGLKTNDPSPYQHRAGLANVGSYQVSGMPFATGSIQAHGAGGAEVAFSWVTSWVMIENDSTQPLRVGFSSNGVLGSNENWYYTMRPSSSLGPVDLKLTQLHLSGGAGDGTSVMAGLTFISSTAINNNNTSISGTNWSGSNGVG